MVEQISTPTAAGQYQDRVYHPLSMLAVASLVAAGGFAGAITLLALVAFFTGNPLFLGLATLLLPALGAVLAFFGRQQIRRSEGMYSGMALTTWALWLSALSGLGYAAYYFGTYFAVTIQAKNFTNKWLEKLKQDKIAEAFLDTQDPGKRKNDKPNDSEWMFQRYGLGGGGRKGPLPQFQESDVVRILQDGAKNGQISILGIKDWSLVTGGYNVEQLVEVTTSEGVFNFLIKTRGSEGKEFEGRQWNLMWTEVGFIVTPRLTPLGKTLEKWQSSARQFVSVWLTKRNQGDTAGLVGAYLDTLPPEEQARLLKEIPLRWLMAQLGTCPGSPCAGLQSGLAGIASSIHLDGIADSYLPGYKEFAAGSLVRTDGFEALKAVREEIMQEVRKKFSRPSVVTMRLPEGMMGGGTLPRINIQNKHQLLTDIEVGIFPNGVETGGAAKYRCDAAVVVESDSDPGSANKNPLWRVVRLQLVRGGVPTPDPAASPRPAPGGSPATPQLPTAPSPRSRP